MPRSAQDVVLTVELVLAAVLGVAGLVSDASGLILSGGALATLASATLSHRLWIWSKRVTTERITARRQEEWEFRPGYLIALLGCAAGFAAMCVDVGEPELALWTFPAAVALLIVAMGRTRVQEFFKLLAFPTRMPPRP